MEKELKRFLLLFFILILFWATGAFVDSALWFHSSYNTPEWVIENMHIFWLLLNQLLLPLAILLVLMPSINTLLIFLLHLLEV